MFLHLQKRKIKAIVIRHRQTTHTTFAAATSTRTTKNVARLYYCQSLCTNKSLKASLADVESHGGEEGAATQPHRERKEHDRGSDGLMSGRH